MSEHIVRSYTEELDQIADDLSRMSGLAESMLAGACEALVSADLERCEEVARVDDEIDRIHEDIERRILRIFALRQPVGPDLRLVFASLKMAADIERIGDLAKNIAKRGRVMDRSRDLDSLKGIERMGRAVLQQMQDVFDAFVRRDAVLAKEVWRNDEEIDQHYNSLFREVLTYMMEDPRMIGAATHLLFIAKNLERIGDHCTNIAETVSFLITGNRLSEEPRPKMNDIDA